MNLKIPAKILSIVFHPMLIILYVLALLIKVDSYQFAFNGSYEEITFYTYTIVNALLIPLVSIFIMKMLGIVKSLEMEDSRERIGPMLVLGSLYLWMFINYKTNQSIPPIFVSLILGSVISIFVAFFINNFTKISLHMLGAGGLIFSVLLMRLYIGSSPFFIGIPGVLTVEISLDVVLILSIILAGLIASARLYLKAHNIHQIYMGLIVGFLAQFIAFRIIL